MFELDELESLPCRDRIAFQRSYILHEVTTEGDYLLSTEMDLISEYVRRVGSLQLDRACNQAAWDQWRIACRSTSIAHSYLGPRWTMPFCYFGSEHAECFKSLAGLDVGCNVLTRGLREFSDRFIDNAKRSGEYCYDNEILEPHYDYYRKYGCKMLGIDLYPISSSPWVSQADLRMLDFRDGVFDFITVAMIIGPSNSVSGVLGAAMCFSELYRTSKRNALIYLADFTVTPAVVFMAMQSGFRVYVNNAYDSGIPIGLFLAKTDSAQGESRFVGVLSALESKEVHFLPSGRLNVHERDLLRVCKMPQAPRKVPASTPAAKRNVGKQYLDIY